VEALIVIALLVLLCAIVLPIVALVRTSRIRGLEDRLAGVEAALLRVMREQGMLEAPPVTPPSAVPAPPPTPPPEAVPAPAPAPPAPPREALETVIGRKWVGIAAIVLLFAGVVYFLKYAFENRWIGELGRVTLGMAGGLVLVRLGYGRHRAGWRYLSQVLTGGGVTILYLSIYGAFGYYHLIDQRSAFAFLAVVVAETFLLSLLYDAGPIAVMALAGGFLVPVILSTGRDNYPVLFTYIGVLDLGMLGVVMARRWRWIGSLAYLATQLLFWGWYGEHYHPEKRAAALLFQAAIFVLFMLADLAPHFRRQAAGWEEWIRLVVNPFVFYATCYGLLNDDHHDWMAVLALALAIVYAALARAELALGPRDRRMLLVTVGTALSFVTLAIPVQLEANWIGIVWSVEALALLWAGFETAAVPLRQMSVAVFGLALFRFLFYDTPWAHRALFTPVFNRYFLGMLALAASLAGAAWLYSQASGAGRRPAQDSGRPALLLVILALAVLWLGSSVETYSFFATHADKIVSSGQPNAYDTARHLRWAGQLSLSLLWAGFAALLTAAGFRRQLPALRMAGLALFGITVLKAVLLDMSELRQFYRIVAVLALGLVLLWVAWTYQRRVRREQTP
jgi:uncharacterized membrane protein